MRLLIVNAFILVVAGAVGPIAKSQVSQRTDLHVRWLRRPSTTGGRQSSRTGGAGERMTSSGHST